MKAPHVLRTDAVLRLLDHHRANHGLARVVGPRGEGMPVRRDGDRVATLQASGPKYAVKALHMALEAIIEEEPEPEAAEAKGEKSPKKEKSQSFPLEDVRSFVDALQADCGIKAFTKYWEGDAVGQSVKRGRDRSRVETE